MKTSLLRVLLLAICVVGVALHGTAQSCVRCGGSPSAPTCGAGYGDGGTICHLNAAGSCTVLGDCELTGCFLAGTIVQTPYGPRALEEVQVGDLVLGVDGNGDHVFNEVVETIRALAHSYYVINNSIEVTGAHPFFVGQRWVPAEELRAGDILATADGTPMLVESISTVEWGVRTFNLSVSGNHTFFADGVLVHNKEGQPTDP